jgi:STE24 endopeptidase
LAEKQFCIYCAVKLKYSSKERNGGRTKAYLILIFCLYAVTEGFEYFLEYLNLRHMKRCGLQVPREFEGKIDESLLKRTEAYEAEKIRFGFISSIFGNAASILFFFGGLLNVYNSWVADLNWPFVLSGVIFFLFLSYANTLLSIPFTLHSTFKIEKKYGFNTMTPKLWLTDFLKSLILSTILTGTLVAVGMWLVQTSPDHWWIWMWIFFLVLSLFIMYISPYVIEPLFNKFSPIGEKGLEDKIKDLMRRVDIRVSRVFKIDASKRSRHTNAYFSGIGRVKRIILYDTLLEKMDDDEILSVLAHEAGHWKKKHVLKMIVLTEIVSMIGIYISYRVLQTDFLTDLFRIKYGTFFAKVAILGFIGGIVSFPFTPLSSLLSRRFERESDNFACKVTGTKEAMVRALIKLSRDNLSNLHPHPLYATFYYSHPPVVQRIRDIRKSSTA